MKLITLHEMKTVIVLVETFPLLTHLFFLNTKRVNISLCVHCIEAAFLNANNNIAITS